MKNNPRPVRAVKQPAKPVGTKRKKNRRKTKIYLICMALAAIVLISAAIILKSMSEHQAYNEYMKQAQEYYYRSDYDNALVVLRKANALEDNDECGMLMAACYESQGNYTRALEVLRAMDTKNPAVSSRIASIEAYRKTLNDSEKIIVAGRQYPVGTSSLVLDNMALNDSVLEELVSLYALDSLSLANNSLSDISPVSKLGGLVTLNLSDNRIENISALSNLSSLRTLYLDNNPISDLSPLYNLSSLSSLSIKGISITESQLQALSRSLPNCAIHSDTAQAEVQDISFGGVTFKSDITELDLSGMGLRDISGISGCEKLTKLNLSGNEISDLSPLMNLPHLQWLDISHTQVSDLRPLMGIDSLTFLNAAGCSINSTSALTMMNGLNQLYLDENPIKDFSGLKKLKTLNVLGLNSTGLDDEGLSYLKGLNLLGTLNIENNPGVSGEAVDELRLYLGTCKIAHSELAYIVDFDNHSVQSNAVELSLPGQGIVDVSGLMRLNKLESADLSGNYISNIYPLSDAECRFTLTSLDLAHNNLSDITPVSLLLNIKHLDLSYNSINSELPLLRLYTLETLDLTGNPLSEEQIDILRKTLVDCEIIF